MKFYEALGLACTSRTDLDTIKEAIVENPDKGGKLQLAQKLDVDDADRHGQRVLEAVRRHQRHRADVRRRGRGRRRGRDRADAAGAVADVDRVREGPRRLPRRARRSAIPWKDGDSSTYAWLDQYCIYVSDLERTIAFYELLGLECTSRTDIPHAKEAILENPERGGKIQLAQQLDNDAPIAMGTAMWKLYVNTDDCEGLHRTAVAAGHTSIMDPLQPDALAGDDLVPRRPRRLPGRARRTSRRSRLTRRDAIRPPRKLAELDPRSSAVDSCCPIARKRAR